jgi:hypothetical protein
MNGSPSVESFTGGLLSLQLPKLLALMKFSMVDRL